jgi:DNA (cytosine-5)-methyltransferase 3A
VSKGINVLSLFDGMSSGRIALERARIPVDKYFASEIDKYAIQVTMKNYPDTIKLCDVTNWRDWDLPKIDLLIGGSPCQGFSRSGKGLNFDDPRSKLFFEYVDIKNSLRPKYFLLENVKMKKEYQDIISEYLEVEPIKINSSLVSAQNRERLYWTNIPNITQPEDKGILLKDIIEYDVFEYDRKNGIGKQLYKSIPLLASDWRGLNRNQKQNAICIQVGEANLKGHDIIKRVYSIEGKSPTLTTMGGGHREPKIALDEMQWRALTPLEMERLQTVPDNYTEGVSNTQRKKMLGNGWTVDVIAHILSFIK